MRLLLATLLALSMYAPAPAPAAAAPAIVAVAAAKGRAAPAKRSWKPKRASWRARWRGAAGRRRVRRWRGHGAVRRPYEPPTPVFIGDLYVQTDRVPLWAAPGSGQMLGRLPRATIVTNMGRHGSYYKVEAPNGAVGFVSRGALGQQAPPW